MAKLCRKIPFGIGAELLVNKGQKFLNYVDGLPNFFGNQMLDKAFKDAVGNRNIFMADGSVLRTRRGVINRSEASIPNVSAERAGGDRVFVALDIYDDTGATRTGYLLFNFNALSAPPRYVAVAGIVNPTHLRDDYTGEIFAGDFTAKSQVIPGVGKCRELIGTLTNASFVYVGTNSTSNYDGSSGLYTQFNQSNKTSVKRSSDDLLVFPEEEYLAVDSWTRAAAPTDISGDATAVSHAYPAYTRHMNAFGFTTKDVLTPGPGQTNYSIYHHTGGRAAAGDTFLAVEGYGIIDESNYLVGVFYRSRTDNKTYLFDASTINGTYFGYSGESQTVAGCYTNANIVTGETGVTSPTLTGKSLPITADSVVTEAVCTIYSNGNSWELLRYDNLVDEIFFVTTNYYQRAGIGKVGLYTTIQYDYATGNYKTLSIGVIKNGVRQQVQYQFSGDLVNFPGTSRYTVGKARILVALAENNLGR